MAIGVFLFTKSNFIRDTELPAFFSELSEGDSIYRLIEQIHNLVDLARRPVLINMIREIVPDLEAIQVAGRRIQGVDIYDRFVKKHLDRDEGKHIFTKTLLFLGQLFASSESGSTMKHIEQLIESGEDYAGLLGLRYWLLAAKHGFPQPSLAKNSLRGQSLYRWSFEGISLSNADFSDAHLSETDWRNASIRVGSFDGALLTQSQFEDCAFLDLGLEGTRANESVFRRCIFDSKEATNAFFVECKGVKKLID